MKKEIKKTIKTKEDLNARVLFEEFGKKIEKRFDEQDKKLEKRFEEFGKKTEKRMLEISHESEKKFERYVGSLSEEFQSRLSAVAEGVTGLSEKIDILTTRLDRVENTLNSHTEMIGNIMENVEMMKSDIHAIKNELKQKVSYDEFTQLEKRVIHLEQKILH
jgi:methyl-accepting chemotaxis protein